MALTLVTASANPLTLAHAKRHLRAEEFNDDDAYIEALLDVAWGHIDGANGWLGSSLAPAVWQLRIDEFPSDDEPLRLPLPPLQTVNEIEYIDIAGATQTLAAYRTFSANAPHACGYVTPAYDSDWPDTLLDEHEAVHVTFTAGYAALPKPVEHAMLLMIGDWYRHRSDATEMKLASLPRGAEALLMPLRNWI